MADSREALRIAAKQIRDEYKLGANTATRVGSLLLALVDAGFAVEELKKLFLSKTGPDETEHLLKLLGGAVVEGGLKADSADIEKFTEHGTFEKGVTTLNLLVQELATIYDLEVTHVATMFRTIIKDYVSSEIFIPGLMGEGFKISKALNGDWNLEVDNVVVRKVMTIFELIISKIRAVNGGLVISAANGRIKSVAETTGAPTYYVLGIEGDMQFVADDLVRCQVFTAGQVKYYWVPVASVTADSILVLKSKFADGVTPVPGDDLIQMGNLTNTARQGLLYLTASEDGKPRFSVLDGVNSTSLAGKSKVILGCLDGMTDTDFPANFQPSGYGLYALNVFLKGVFLLRNGKNVEDEVNAAKDAAQDAKNKADAVTRLFQEFTVAGGIFESKITEVKEYTDAAKNAAINAAALDAQTKANAAQSAAESVAIAKAALAKTEANTYADGIVTAEEQRAINDAKAKLDEAKRDAQAKADAAKNAAINDSAGKYNTKSEVSSLISQTKSEINLSVTEKVSAVQTQITANASAIEVNKQGISLKASQSEVNGLGARLQQAEISLQPGNIWLGIRDSVLNIIPRYSTQVDTRSLDPNKYYLVTIGMTTTVPYTITVERSLNSSYGVPSYSTHQDGFSLICKWQSNGLGWGTIATKRIIQTLEYAYVGSCPVGGIGQISQSSEEYIYVRGGSLYNVWIDGTSSTSVTLRTSIHTPYPDHPSSSRPGVVDSVVQPVPDLDTKPSKDELLSTGIDISNRKIVLTSDRVVFQNNSGGQIALFENDRIKAGLIDARAIVTGALVAEQIAATNITTGKLTVTDGARIGGWSVSGNDLTCNGEGSAKIKVEISGTDFFRINDKDDAFLSIRRDDGNCIRLQTYSRNSVALGITANGGGGMAIESAGGHKFMQRSSEIWNAPGVLWCGRYNTENGGLTSWGNGTASSPSVRRFGTGGYTVTHNLNHTQYFVSVLPIIYNGNWQNWAIIPRYADLGSNAFNLYFRATNDSDVDPKEFMVMIYGRNKW